MEKFGHIKNPLSIIAIFASIAEIFGTNVLPEISGHNQYIFVWFLVLFPSVLVLLFFATLNWNHKVLYAPSDYKDEKNFMEALIKRQVPLSVSMEKFTQEALEFREVERENPNVTVQSSEPSEDVESAFAEFAKIEERALAKILKKYPGTLVRSISFGSGLNAYTFDGVIARANELLLIDMRYIHDHEKSMAIYEDQCAKMGRALSNPEADDIYKKGLLFIVLATFNVSEHDRIKSYINSAVAKYINIPVTIEVIGIDGLMR